MLRALTAQLNDPRLTGAVVPPEEKPKTTITEVPAWMAAEAKQVLQAKHAPVGMTAEAAAALQAQMVLQQSQSIAALPGPLTPHEKKEAPIKLSTAPVPASLPKAEHQPAQRIFFTGQPFSGKKWLAEKIKARVFGFDDPIRALAASVFGEVAEEPLRQFIATVRAFGDNDQNTPLSVTRAMFFDYMREAGAEGDTLMGVPVSTFGSPGFWTRSLLARIARFQEDERVVLEKFRVKQDTEAALDALASRQQPEPTVVVVCDLSTPAQYTSLREAGFKPYHVACHVNTRASRGAIQSSVNPLATEIEGNLTKDLSQNPGGKKLWCIWNDTEQPRPSGRLMSLPEFLDAYK
jgi:hypothetical protein